MLRGRHEPGLGIDSSKMGQDSPGVFGAMTVSSAPPGCCCVQTGTSTNLHIYNVCTFMCDRLQNKRGQSAL